MNVVLLDTNVASLLHPKKKAAALRDKYEPHLRGQTLALSFQSVAELWDWAEANRSVFHPCFIRGPILFFVA